MLSFRIPCSLALAALLSSGCTQPVDEASSPALVESMTVTEADGAAVLDFVNGSDFDRLTSEGGLDGEVATALLEHRRGNGRFGSLAQLTAVLESAPIPVASGSLCDWYQKMAQYYSIRALQCAYSACYPLSPWYGYMGQYYSALAASVCDPV